MTNSITSAPVSSPRAPLHSDISQCAKNLWADYGRPEGRDEEIWLEAERRLLAATAAQQGSGVISPPVGLVPENRTRLARRRSQINVDPSPPPPAPKRHRT